MDVLGVRIMAKTVLITSTQEIIERSPLCYYQLARNWHVVSSITYGS